MKTKQKFLTTLATVAFVAGSAGAYAQTVMNFSHFVPTGHQVHAVSEMWAKSIEENSGNRIDVRIFPAEQLGKALDHYDMITSGAASAGWFVPSYSPGRFPIIDAGELHFLVSDAAKGARVIHEWYAEYAENEMSEIKFCAIVTHDPGRIHLRSPVSSAEEIKGIKIRQGSATIGNYLAALGAVPVKMPSPEVRQSVDRGLVDGATFPWHTVVVFGLADALKHHIDLPFYIPMAMYGVSKSFYDGLSDEDKAVIDAHCTPEWSEKLSANWADWEKEGRTILEESGDHTFVTFEGDGLQPWRDAAEGQYGDWKAQVRERNPELDPDAMMSDLQARLEAAGAGL